VLSRYGGNGPGTASEEIAYKNRQDPCGVADDPESLFIDQAWSLSGVIDDTGVTLEDSMDAVEVNGIAAPFGPFSSLNANAGPHRINIAPIGSPHQVGFWVQGIITDGGQLAAIVSGDQINWFTAGEAHPSSDSSGYLEFYGVVDRRRSQP
jgi:hypothetical protein